MFQGYYNPYTISRGASFFSWLKGIKWSSLLDGTQKTLGVINQAIPIMHQVKPIMQNARTMLRIAKEVNGDSTQSNESVPKSTINSLNNTNKPQFFL